MITRRRVLGISIIVSMVVEADDNNFHFSMHPPAVTSNSSSEDSKITYIPPTIMKVGSKILRWIKEKGWTRFQFQPKKKVGLGKGSISTDISTDEEEGSSSTNIYGSGKGENRKMSNESNNAWIT